MNDSTEQTIAKPERVRFDRSERSALTQLPSHAGVARGPVRRGRSTRRRGRWRFAAKAALGFILAFGALIALVTSGAFDRQLAERADAVLAQSVPAPFGAMSEATEVGFSWPPSLGVIYSGFQIADQRSQTVVASAQTLSVNLDIMRSLSGTPVFSGVTLSGLTIDAQAIERSGETAPMKTARLEQAPIIFDQVATALRGAMAGAADADHPVKVTIADARIALPPNQYTSTVTINQGSAIVAANDITISASGKIADQETVIDGKAALNATDKLSVSLSAGDLVFPVKRLRTFLSNNDLDHEPDADPEPVLFDLSIAANDASERNADQLIATITPKDLSLKLADNDFLPVRGRARLAFQFEDNTITWMPDAWRLGQSVSTVSARIRQQSSPDDAAPEPFEFEMLFNRGRITPADSPERPLTFASRVQGLINLDERRIDYTNLELDTSEGYARAEGVITLADDPPLAVFDVSTNDMTIAGLKQLWPAPVAREARRWTLNGLAGGRVLESRFQIAEPLRRRVPGTDIELEGDSRIEMAVEGVRFDLSGDLPPVRDASGSVSFEDKVTRIEVDSGTMFLPSGKTAQAGEGMMVIQPPDENGLVMARADATISGSADVLGEIIQLRPIEAQRFYEFVPEDLSGDVSGDIALDFALNADAIDGAPEPDWTVDLEVRSAGSAVPIEGRRLSNLDGSINVTPSRAVIDVEGLMDGLDADIALTIPFEGSDVAAERRVVLNLDDAARQTLAPGIDVVLTGSTPVTVGGSDENITIDAELENATFSLPWIGWSKGRGIPAEVAFDLLERGSRTVLDDFSLDGDGFGARGRIEVASGGLSSVRMERVWLNPGDNFSVSLSDNGEGYDINVEGSTADLRALMRHVRTQLQSADETIDRTPVNIEANLGAIAGFNGEVMRNVSASARIRNGGISRFSVTGTGSSGMPFSVVIQGQAAERRMRVEAFDAGEFLRFLDIYNQIQGGALGIDLTAASNGDLIGPMEIRDFRIFNEPALDRLVNTSSDARGSLRDAVNRDLDLREVPFERGTATLNFGTGTLDVSEAFIRGPLVGFALQGRVFDRNNRTRITGTFLPAYGLNSVFAEIPLLGLILGNGRDRGLIGVTFLLEGDFDNPKVTVNPLSVIAPGIFRNIFQFR
ncbi:MAG: AsmA-like C-terminal region-containing protein [Pseudomonadota bacterium]